MLALISNNCWSFDYSYQKHCGVIILSVQQASIGRCCNIELLKLSYWFLSTVTNQIPELIQLIPIYLCWQKLEEFSQKKFILVHFIITDNIFWFLNNPRPNHRIIINMVSNCIRISQPWVVATSFWIDLISRNLYSLKICLVGIDKHLCVVNEFVNTSTNTEMGFIFTYTCLITLSFVSFLTVWEHI